MQLHQIDQQFKSGVAALSALRSFVGIAQGKSATQAKLAELT